MNAEAGPFKVVGTSPIRHDGVDKVTGRARYGIDASMANMLHGKVLRSPHAHARILGIDTSAAESLPGVHAVVTARDLASASEGALESNEQGLMLLRYKVLNMLARDRALYQGHAIAAVAAVDPHLAEEALGLIDVQYEVLPAVLDGRAAMKPDAPVLLPNLRTARGGTLGDRPTNVASHVTFEEGDIERGFAAADLIVERAFTTPTVSQSYLEPLNATAFWRSDGQLEIECSTQGHFSIRDELARILQWPASQIKVTPLEIGGGFGAKTTSWLETCAALLSRKAGRPVKMTMTRAEVLMAAGPAEASAVRVKLGVTSAGRITACQAEMVLEAGAFPPSAIDIACQCGVALYDLENFRVDGYDVVVNKPKATAYRAPGSPQAAFAMESVVDEICELLGMDPLEFRLKNAPKEGSLRADGTRFGRIGMVECLEAARRSDHARTPVAQIPGVKRGRGVAGGFWVNGGRRSSVSARLNADGTVTLLEGSIDLSGTRTAIAMQLAEALGIPLDRVNAIVPDTDALPPSHLSGGSRVTFATGLAAHQAGTELRGRMASGLSRIWDVAPDQVAFADGAFVGPTQRLDFREASRVLAAHGEVCSAHVTVDPTAVSPAYAVHVADVEVDERTGRTRVIRYTAVQDVGKAIYPPYAEGQIQGGAVQGIGWALNEEYSYDADGHLLNRSLLDYRMPTALDLPMIETIMVEVANPLHPYGARGVGEIPIVPPLAAIANAVHDAVGVRIRDLPITPARLARALAARSATEPPPVGATGTDR